MFAYWKRAPVDHSSPLPLSVNESLGRKFRVALYIIIGAYTVVLLIVELQTSQDYVRHYFTDITGPVLFYAVNTTLSVFALWATALVFAACLVAIEEVPHSARERRFYWSQILVFGYLGCDDRFLLHERLGHLLGIHDYYSLLGIGILEVVLLLTWGDFKRQSHRSKRYVVSAALMFAVMIVIDGFVPHHMTLRLSMEDLAKIWGGAFLFLFAWHIYCEKISALKPKALSGDVPSDGA